MVDSRAQGREDPCGAAPSWETANELIDFKDSLNREHEQPASGSLPEGDWYQVPEHYDPPATGLSPETPSGDNSGVSCPGSSRKTKTTSVPFGTVANCQQSPYSFRSVARGYQCIESHCIEQFDSEGLLQDHLETAHRGRSSTYAASCSSRESSSSQGAFRCLGVDPKTYMPCTVTFNHPIELHHHVSSVHKAPERPYKCQRCREDTLFVQYNELVRHYRVCHPKDDVPADRHILKSVENDAQ